MLNNQLSSSQINETLLNAMKAIAQKEVQNLEFDVTEKYIIKRKAIDAVGDDCYIIEVNGVEQFVYSINQEEYSSGDIVLVNIPKNNYTEKKYIIGLANKTINKYFLPDSNFISIVSKTVASKSFSSEADIVFLTQFRKDDYIEEFQQCNAIYLKCDFKVDALAQMDYIYGIQLNIQYVDNGYTKSTPLTLQSDLFTGNPNLPYFFTQDIMFEDLDFLNIQTIDAIFLFSDKRALDDVVIRNLEISLGKAVSSAKAGIDIIAKKNILTYNDEQDDFYRNLGLVWYNRNEDGDFIGFDTGIEIPVDSNGVINYSEFVADEYDYVEKKTAYERMSELYETGVCPMDVEGLEYIYEIGLSENEIADLKEYFKEASSLVTAYISNYSEMLTSLMEKLANPKNITSNDEDYNALRIKYDKVISTLKYFSLYCESLRNDYNSINIKISEWYNIWKNYIAQLFLNVRDMQLLKELDLEQLKLNKLYIPSSGGIPSTKELNYSTIISMIYEEKEKMVSVYFTNGPFVQKEQVLTDTIVEYLDACKKLTSDNKKKQEWDEVYKDLNSLTARFQVFDIYNCLKKRMDSFFRDTYGSVVLSELNNGKFYWTMNQALIDCNYPNESQKYYNTYYQKYKNYLSIVDKEKRPESIVDEELLFINKFNYPDVDKETFSIYWYQEDLLNSEEDPLLGEAYWTLISSKKVDNKYKSCFPSLYEKGSNLHKKYYFKKSTPYENMIQVHLSDRLPTTTFKVVIYHNHELQDSATITFTNQQYEDIGFDNSLIDIEYATDIYTLSQFQKYGAYEPTALPLSLICYDSKNATETMKINNITRSKKVIKYPCLQMRTYGPMGTESCKNVTDEESSNWVTGTKNEIIAVFKWNDQVPLIHPWSVEKFTLWQDAETKSSAFFPFAWCLENHSLSLHGTKMVYLNDDGNYEFDQWEGDKTTAQEYTLKGGNNFKNLKFEILYYDCSGNISDGIKRVNINKKIKENNVEKIVQDITFIEGDAFSLITQQNNNETIYKLSFDPNKARNCLKYYNPVLCITGTEGNRDEKFTYYQSLFIQHPQYDYELKKFIDEVPVDASSSLLTKEGYKFLKPAEAELVTELQKHRLELMAAANDQAIMIDKAKLVLETSDTEDAYRFYFNNNKSIPSRERYRELIQELETGTKNWSDSIEYQIYSTTQKKYIEASKTAEEWMSEMFKSLVTQCEDYEATTDAFKTSINLYYEDLEKIKLLLEKMEE